MNIMVATNEKYLKYASVLFHSIIENNKESDLVFYVIYSGGECQDKYILENEINEIGYEIKYIVPNNSLFSNMPRISENFVLATYYTLFPHLFLPKEMDRVLYLDIDMVVISDLAELYNMDFENNYLIAANQVPGFFGESKYDDKKKKKGAYFNSGMVLYNLNKMKKEISEDFYDYCLLHSDEFFYDQGMLNWLFCEKTKYVETLEYNWRYDVARRNKKIKCIPHIIHYVCYGMPYKPWDLYLEKDELTRLCGTIDLVYDKRSFYIDEEVNDNLLKWWKYAEESIFYDRLLSEMRIKKEYLIRTGVIQRVNKNLKEELKYEDYKWIIVNRKNYILDNIIESENYCRIKSIEQFVSFINICDKNRYMFFISIKDDTSKYWKQFVERIGFDLETIGYREGYIAILDEGVIYQIKGYGLLSKSFIFTHNYNSIMEKGEYLRESYITLLSSGYNKADGTSLSSILINNIDYSLNGRGANVVIFDKKLNGVVDSFCVNTYSNDKFDIIRI